MTLIWNESYNLAKKYYEYHGNLLVPRDFKTKNGYEYDKDGYHLGNWISRQRVYYKNINIPKEQRNFRDIVLTPQQIELLNKIGMVYVVRELISWDEWYKLAKKYYEHHGNLLIPEKFKTKDGYNYDDDGYHLGTWIINQRVAYKNIKKDKNQRNNNLTPLTTEQINLLNQIGMIYEEKCSFSWEEWYKLAKKYYEHHGNLLMPQTFKTKNGYEYDLDGYSLGRWVINQRRAYRNKILSKEKRISSMKPLTDKQIELLEIIGMIFDFKNNKQKLIELCETYGLNYKKYSYLIQRHTYKELNAKINFLIDNNYEITELGEPNEIFYMSEINMKEAFWISKKELFKYYYEPNIEKMKIIK